MLIRKNRNLLQSLNLIRNLMMTIMTMMINQMKTVGEKIGNGLLLLAISALTIGSIMDNTGEEGEDTEEETTVTTTDLTVDSMDTIADITAPTTITPEEGLEEEGEEDFLEDFLEEEEEDLGAVVIIMGDAFTK